MKLLLYCTKSKPYLFKKYNQKKFFLFNKVWKDTIQNALNGKIVAECDYEVEEMSVTYADYYHEELAYNTHTLTFDELLEKSCLNNQQLDNYLYGDNGYAIHIKNLHIFDEPKKLSNYYKAQSTDGYSPCWNCKIFGSGCYTCNIKPPQNMMYVYDRQGNKYALISIRPEWLCKILNGEKTIEVRKKVLKEMVKNDK